MAPSRGRVGVDCPLMFTKQQHLAAVAVLDCCQFDVERTIVPDARDCEALRPVRIDGVAKATLKTAEAAGLDGYLFADLPGVIVNQSLGHGLTMCVTEDQ